jgi:hypothetical protein
MTSYLVTVTSKSRALFGADYNQIGQIIKCTIHGNHNFVEKYGKLVGIT